MVMLGIYVYHIQISSKIDFSEISKLTAFKEHKTTSSDQGEFLK